MYFRLLLLSCLALGACSGTETGQQSSKDRFALPTTLDLDADGYPSSVEVADIDGDGFNDLVALVPKKGNSWELTVVVAWGAAEEPFSARTIHVLPGPVPLNAGGSLDTRDFADVIELVDFDGDGQLDVLMCQGWLKNEGARSFAYAAFTGAGQYRLLLPVAATTFDGALVAVRGTFEGTVERCLPSGQCTPLSGQNTVCPPETLCEIEDLVIGDFDHDGAPDVLAGGIPIDVPYTEGSMLWMSSKQWSAPLFIEQMHPVDYEVGDINGDGFPDLVAQRREFISDFPSYTDVWISDPTSPSYFRKTQTIYNNDNHNDNAALADANGDGCLDLMMVGADEVELVIRLGTPQGGGCAEYLGDHDPSNELDVGWPHLPAPNAIGVQQIDVNGDGADEWVLRTAVGNLLHFMPIPADLESLLQN